jgi:hypothetical protein
MPPLPWLFLLPFVGATHVSPVLFLFLLLRLKSEA